MNVECSMLVFLLLFPEGPSTQYSRTLAPKTIPLMVFGTRVLQHWVLGPSGIGLGLEDDLVPTLCSLQQEEPSCSGLYPWSCTPGVAASFSKNSLGDLDLESRATRTAALRYGDTNPA